MTLSFWDVCVCVLRKEGGCGDARAEALGEGSGRASFENPRGEGGGTSERFQLQLSSYVQVCEEDGGLNGGGIICIWVW